ncbi:sigma factor [Streptomyces sp. NPDC048438]|uniref:sigma factor n=1 Tax=Streptomyces sp. NPDC048438 TaxID=3365551 RepID=UPI00372340CC
MRQSKEDAFREFAEARMGHLFRSACLLTGGDTHLAEDLVQETLGRMYAVWGRTSRVGNPAAYAQTVLVRCYLGHRRRRSAGRVAVVGRNETTGPPLCAVLGVRVLPTTGPVIRAQAVLPTGLSAPVVFPAQLTP